MAFLGLRTKDAGLGSSSTVDMLVKALTGDPEREMALARGRADLDLNEYRQRQMEATAALAEAQTATEQYQLNQRTTNEPVIADYYAGLVEPPVPVTTPGALPAPAPELPDPVSVAEPAPLPEYALPPVGADVRSLLFQADQRPEIRAAAEPVSVDHPFAERPGELLPNEGTVQMPQPDMLPGEVVPPSQEEIAAYQREVAAARARAALIIGGGGNAAQVGQGLGIGEGIIKTGSDDPVVRSQGNVLYTGTNPPEATAGPGASPYLKQELEMKSKLEGLDAYKKLSAIVPVYGSMLKSAGGPLDEAAVLDLVYGLATAEDPGSVVRETDSIAVKRLGGLSGELQGIVSYIAGGAPIDAGVVAKIMRTAKNRYTSYKQAWDWQARQATDIATRSGYDVRNAIPTFEELGDYEAAPPVDPADAAADDAKYGSSGSGGPR